MSSSLAQWTTLPFALTRQQVTAVLLRIQPIASPVDRQVMGDQLSLLWVHTRQTEGWTWLGGTQYLKMVCFHLKTLIGPLGFETLTAWGLDMSHLSSDLNRSLTPRFLYLASSFHHVFISALTNAFLSFLVLCTLWTSSLCQLWCNLHQKNSLDFISAQQTGMSLIH